MDSSVLKAAALGWLRYGRRMPLVCSEVGRWNADVVGVNKTTSIEVEVKSSKSDLRREFKTKRSKHYLYNNSESQNVPTYLYFLVPYHLGDEAVALTSEHSPKAGVLTADQEDEKPYHRATVTLLKKAERLRAAPPSPAFVRQVMLRCSSELCGLRYSEATFRRRVLDSLRDESEKALWATARAAGTLDVEDPRASLLLRAKELALAVGGKPDELTPDVMEQWTLSAQRLADAEFWAVGDVNEKSLF